mmetsp:Transcript_8249/g.23180  ORF Transcript_8249/g.23180 Transcript_8249/m.23180 type:complete len:247 (-) Transcript_8249:154-894(-)
MLLRCKAVALPAPLLFFSGIANLVPDTCQGGGRAQGASMLQTGQHTHRKPSTESGIWSADESTAYWGESAANEVSPCIASAIRDLIHAKGYRSLADYGAGLGGYAMYLKEEGVQDVRCYDGNEAIVNSSHGLCQVVDISVEQPQLPAVDLVMSFEVGEHIPKAREAAFLDNLRSASAQALVLSWAKPGQGGTGHVNEQPQEYIIGQMTSRGFRFDEELSAKMREEARGCPGTFWFYDPGVTVFWKS